MRLEKRSKKRKDFNLSEYFTSDENRIIGDAFSDKGCHDPQMEVVSQGELRKDKPFYHSGIIRISCNEVSKDYTITKFESTHMEYILQDIHNGFFDRY